MVKKKSLLISFAGSNDPYGRGDKAPTGGKPYGPLISAVKKGNFDHIIVLSSKQLKENAENTVQELKKLYPDKTVEIYHTEIEDPSSHLEIINNINQFIKEKEEVLYKKDFDIFISITSGTPAMHACWLLFSASNRIKSKIIHVKEARYTPSGEPEIVQINFTQNEFVIVSQKITHEWEKDETQPPTSFADYGLIGQSENFIKACQKTWRYAKQNIDILKPLESGTGKELFAEMIHKVSGRKGKFIPFHCAGTTETLFESELFGHKKGAFTGATSDRPGLCKEANDGTLFFDEIGDVPLNIQIKLLRFLENKKYRPVGSDKEEEANVRFVFATNKNLDDLVKEEKMREDFYYRINHSVVNIPPLRERVTDIHLLVEYFINKFDNKTPKIQITPEAMQKLTRHNWPGNIRELKSIIEQAIIDCGDTRIITPELINFKSPKTLDYLKNLPPPHIGFSLDEFEKKIHDHYINKALELANNNQSEAARMLGITPQALSQYLKKRGNLNDN